MQSGGSTCCILNLAPLYRAPILKLMDKELKCDFYIGDKVSTAIKLMNYNELTGFIKILKNVSLFAEFYWQQGSANIAFKPYKNFIITGDPNCISTWVFLIINRLLGKKVFLWSHGWYGREGNLKKLIKKIFFGLGEKVLLYGNHARSLMINAGFNPSKLIVIYNSLDYKTQIMIREKLTKCRCYSSHFGNDDPVVIFIGRLQKEKKLHLLIESQNLLAKEGINFNIVLIGDGNDEMNLKLLTSKYSLDNKIWFYGSCYDENEIAYLIYNAELTISPGNIGLTAIHSMTYGTPVLTHSNFKNHGPEFEAIIPGKTGDFFEEDSMYSLIDKIKVWLSLPERKRRYIRENCFAVIETKYNPFLQISIFRKLVNGSI